MGTWTLLLTPFELKDEFVLFFSKLKNSAIEEMKKGHFEKGINVLKYGLIN